MLTKTILKKALNVKHTSIDNVTFDPDDSINVHVHPTKGEQCRCGKCGRKAPRYVCRHPDHPSAPLRQDPEREFPCSVLDII